MPACTSCRTPRTSAWSSSGTKHEEPSSATPITSSLDHPEIWARLSFQSVMMPSTSMRRMGTLKSLIDKPLPTATGVCNGRLPASIVLLALPTAIAPVISPPSVRLGVTFKTVSRVSPLGVSNGISSLSMLWPSNTLVRTWSTRSRCSGGTRSSTKEAPMACASLQSDKSAMAWFQVVTLPCKSTATAGTLTASTTWISSSATRSLSAKA
mmetsp:Transcript_73807/g.213796  ORF Transcript_73807/g.213796 Transcript_73807/m.213796 type:complete len:210 (+) Transcript_73807:5661-6290(+)